MAYLKALLTARLVSLFGSLAFTLAVVGLSGKGESNIRHWRRTISPVSAGADDRAGGREQRAER